MIPFEWIKICREPRHFSEVVVQRYNLTWLTWNIGRNIFDRGHFLKKFNLKEHRARDRHMLTFANENREENKTVSVHWICNLNVNWQDPDLRKRTCMLDFFFFFFYLPLFIISHLYLLIFVFDAMIKIETVRRDLVHIFFSMKML